MVNFPHSLVVTLPAHRAKYILAYGIIQKTPSTSCQYLKTHDSHEDGTHKSTVFSKEDINLPYTIWKMYVGLMWSPLIEIWRTTQNITHVRG